MEQDGTEPGGWRFWLPATGIFVLLTTVCALVTNGQVALPVGLSMLMLATVVSGAVQRRRPRLDGNSRHRAEASS